MMSGMMNGENNEGIPGNVFLYGNDSLKGKIDRFIADAEGDLRLNMEGMDFLDSTTLAYLVRCASRLFVTGRSVYLYNCNSGIQKVIALAGLEDFLKID